MPEKHFLIIGGTRGIGRALVKHLAGNSGNRISVLGRNPAADADSPAQTQYAVDVKDQAALISCLDQAVARHGKIDCAVFMQRHRGGKEDFDTDLAVALTATRNAIDHLVDQQYFSDNHPSNSIVLVSSIADRYIAPEQSLGYHVGKAGFSQLARYYALKLGAKGIRVNTVSPCVVAKDEAKNFYDANEWLVDRFRTAIPLGRIGTPLDIVNAIMFLAGDQSSYITGQNIVVDGGLTLRSHESLIREFPLEG